LSREDFEPNLKESCELPRDTRRSAKFLPARSDGSLVTYRGSVKRWECDADNNWNMDLYARAFQIASETLAMAATGLNPGVATAALRLFRVHHELSCSTPTTVRSARIVGGGHDGLVVHVMETGSNGHIVATALDVPGYNTEAVSGLSVDDIAFALPHGIASGPHHPQDFRSGYMRGNAFISQFGVVCPEELDHIGGVFPSAVISRCSAVFCHLLDRIGLTRDWKLSTKSYAAVVEVKMTRHRNSHDNASLRLISWMHAVTEGSFTIRHQIEHPHTGSAVATVEQLGVIAHIETRRLIQLPRFVYAAKEALGILSSNSFDSRREASRR